MLDIAAHLEDNYELFCRNTDKVHQMADDNNEGNEALDLSGLGSFDFTPDWAKGRADDKSRYARFEGREGGHRGPVGVVHSSSRAIGARSSRVDKPCRAFRGRFLLMQTSG